MTSSNGHTSTNGSDASQSRYLFEPRRLRVVCIGAGLSGIYLGIKLPEATENVDFVIYEKNERVGGTWFENTYPGCACDIPAHRYSYTFASNPNWSTFYATSSELQRYFEGVSERFGASKYVRTQHTVTSAYWNEEDGKWDLKVKSPDGESEDRCDVLVSASGALNSWKWPNIAGLRNFNGKLVHSACWDHSVDLKDKKVAVIGSGSSGIQIIPAILPQVNALGAYLRSPTWITPPLGLDLLRKDENGEYIYDYSEEQLKDFQDPENLLEYRRNLERGVSKAFRLFTKGSQEQEQQKAFLVEYMKGRLSKRPELAEKLIPDWDVGCRRLTPGIGYLEALCDEKVDPIFQEITQVTKDGIVQQDGTEKAYDVIICATGFDVSYRARFPLVGRNGHELDEAFADNPKSYFAMAYAELPNYFCFNGPNAPVGAGSLIPSTEAQGDYIVKVIQKMQSQNIKSICVKRECVEDFASQSDEYMETTVWTSHCRSWYKNGKVDGRVTALWPGSGLHYIDSLENPRWEDYDYTHVAPNRYAYLGNGFTKLEVEGADRTAGLGAAMQRFKDHPHLLSKQPAATNGWH